MRDPCETCTRPSSSCEFCPDSRESMIRALSQLQNPRKFVRDFSLTPRELAAILNQPERKAYYGPLE